MPPPRPNFPMSDLLVDLDVKDVPLAEAIAKLSKDSGVDMVVDKAVPEGIKVSAKIYKMQLNEVLSLLTGQANLTYSVGHHENKYMEPDQSLVRIAEVRDREGLATPEEIFQVKQAARPLPIIYIVPLPELSVSTPGTARGGGSMGGGYGGVRAR